MKIWLHIFFLSFLLLTSSVFGDTVTVYQQTFDSPWNTGDWGQYTPQGGAWATELTPFICQGDQSVTHQDDWDEPVNGWIVSPAISLQAGITYTCSHLQRVGSSSYPENMGTYIYQGNGADFTPDSATAKIWQADDLTNVDCMTRSNTFTVPSDGNYHIVFHCTSPAGEFLAIWDDVKITQPTLVQLTTFTAKGYSDHVLLAWETASELDNAGFHLWRSQNKDWGYERITKALIPAEGTPTFGASYSFEDQTAQPGRTYYYQLEDMDIAGNSFFHSTVSAWPGVVNIRVNESDGPVKAEVSEPVKAMVQTHPKNSTDAPEEWWLCCDTPFGWYCYGDSGEWIPGIYPCKPVPPDKTSGLQVLDMVLPAGNYIFYFATDLTKDGSPMPHWLDAVGVTIE